MDTAGAMVGVLLAAGLVWLLTGSPAHGEREVPQGEGWVYRTAFGIAAALGLISWAITFFVRESAAERKDEVSAPADGKLGLPGSYWRAVTLMLVFALANSSDTFLLLRAKQVGLSAWAVVLAYALFNLTYTLLSYPAGVVSDRLGRWRVVALGWAIYAGVYVGFAFTDAAWVWGLFPLYGAYMALTDGVGKALVSDHAPRVRRGTALGIYGMASGVVTLGASVVAGVLWERVGPWAPFAFGAAVAGVAVVLVPVLRARGLAQE
jgi:MFS family permease